MIVAWLLLALAADRPAPLGAVERVGRLEHPAIREASGIVASRRHPGIYWVHNDSGNPPAIFAVRRDGSLVREYPVGVPNVDWEDIAADDAGHLYLGEIGNNGGKLPLRAIYRVDEPDPAVPAEKPLPVTLSTFYRFPAGGRFDAESLVIEGKRALIIAKYLDGREAEVFAVPLDPPASIFGPALPERVATLPGFVEAATGADLSPDGTRLAVCSLGVTRVYGRAGTGWKLVGQARYDAGQVEAIAWEGADLILANEGRDLFRIAAGRP